MPLVLVHGVPEADTIWEGLRSELDRDDVITLSPPGFGAPVPEGFGATSDGYLAWLIDALEALDGPVDLVGHDWGGGHVLRVAATRPDLIRSWCIDMAGITDPAYVWHDLAQAWQTPGVGEAAIAEMFGAPLEARIESWVGFGADAETARKLALAGTPAMGACILTLYRSSLQPKLTEWGIELDTAERRPGLVINATEDGYVGGPDSAHRAALRFGAQEARLEGLGHWWMLQNPRLGAAALNKFYTTVA
ncbi:alpha/beta hydrolase [Catenulispora sp. NF23]|uniref:Alpha/beta hydrolase n=1 Tax=Catenulispora pinistramenti TaxID=2705254 RepID=A0ABS5KQJ3_9ACTN|nr:alpha/beta hydrolase [Catenulispora pinistramenti]MBS2538415.1 alpha/beta hydrolase [Catenulispora pinistramenti]MBS2548321.1 alpha/beta hydrolase [Catenulispora pinistramenti]